MGWWNDVKTWFTGRNGIYKDDDKINAAIDELTSIAGSVPDTLDTPIKSAIAQLNGVKGFAENVGQLDQGAFTAVTGEAKTGVDVLIEQIDAKVKDMDEYEKGNFFQKLGGTLSMTIGKIGEGFCSVFEGLGDAVITAGAWIANAPKIVTGEDTAASKWLQDKAKFNVSEWLMSPLTKNELAAKYSAFTIDSGAASMCKGIGKTAGYMFAGGQLAGIARGAAGGTALVANASATGVAGVMQSTTYATSAIAAVSGFGQGTQTGLQSGKGLEMATVQGLAEGAVEGGTMLIAGKLGERAQLSKLTKEYNNAIDGLSGAAKTSATNRMATELEKQAGQIAANGGFNSNITKAGLESGFKAQQAFKSAGGGLKGIATGAGSLIKSDAKMVADPIKNNFTKTKVTDSAGKAVKGDDLKNLKELAKNEGKTIEAKATELGYTTKNGIAPMKGIAKTSADVLKSPYTVVKNIVTPGEGMGTTVYKAKGGEFFTAAPTVVGNATALGGEVALGGATNAIDLKTGIGINSDKASAQFRQREAIKDQEKDLKDTQGDPKDWRNMADTTQQNTPTGPNNSTGTNNSTGSNNPTGPNTSSNGGGGGGGDNYDPGNGGGGYNPSPGNSEDQFRQNDASDTNTSQNESTSNNSATEPNTSSNVIFGNESNTPTGQNDSKPPTEEVTTPGDPETPSGDNPAPGATVPTGGTNPEPSHGGGGYSYNDGYSEEGYTDGTIDGEVGSIIDEIVEEEEFEEVADSIGSIIDGGNNYTKLPTNNNAVNPSGSSGSAVIPVIAGLSAAAAAGIGAKAYMDRKNNNDNGEDDLEAEDWDGDDNYDVDYNDGVEQQEYLDDDNYDSEYENTEEKYGARNNEELADLQ